MIVIDTSALIAVTNHEAERQRILEVIAAADRCAISAMTVFETAIVVYARFGETGLSQLAAWIATFSPEIVAFDEQQAQQATNAYKRFGRGAGGAARLNFGDCAAYALAKSQNVPLLYKGADFAATDIEAAM